VLGALVRSVRERESRWGGQVGRSRSVTRRSHIASRPTRVSSSTCSSAATKQEIGGVDGTRAGSPSQSDSAARLRTASRSTDRAKLGMLAGCLGRVSQLARTAREPVWLWLDFWRELARAVGLEARRARWPPTPRAPPRSRRASRVPWPTRVNRGRGTRQPPPRHSSHARAQIDEFPRVPAG
jgi:hypothetical protein